MISISGLVYAVLYLIIIGVIVWLLIWLVDYCGIPEPFHKIAKILIAVVSVIICILLLLSLVSGKQVFSP